MECSPPGSSVHGISQARILEWIAIPFSRGSARPRDRTHIPCVSCIAGGFFARWATEDSINILILPILHVETVPKERWSLSQRHGYCRCRVQKRGTANSEPGDLQWMPTGEKPEVASGQRPLCSESAFGRVSGALLLPYSGVICSFLFFLPSSILSLRVFEFII